MELCNYINIYYTYIYNKGIAHASLLLKALREMLLEYI
jgi:hypothetical protein